MRIMAPYLRNLCPGKKKRRFLLSAPAALVLSGIVVGGIAAGVFIGSAYAARQSGLLTVPQQGSAKDTCNRDQGGK